MSTAKFIASLFLLCNADGVVQTGNHTICKKVGQSTIESSCDPSLLLGSHWNISLDNAPRSNGGVHGKERVECRIPQFSALYPYVSRVREVSEAAEQRDGRRRMAARKERRWKSILELAHVDSKHAPLVFFFHLPPHKSDIKPEDAVPPKKCGLQWGRVTLYFPEKCKVVSYNPDHPGYSSGGTTRKLLTRFGCSIY